MKKMILTIIMSISLNVWADADGPDYEWVKMTEAEQLSTLKIIALSPALLSALNHAAALGTSIDCETDIMFSQRQNVETSTVSAVKISYIMSCPDEEGGPNFESSVGVEYPVYDGAIYPDVKFPKAG